MRHALCWTAVLLLCGTAVRAEDEYEDAFGLLAKLQEDLGSKLSRIPDYVCNADIVETVSSVNPSHVVRRSQARVQAGLIQGEELFSWAEESHFRRYEELQRGYPGIVSYSRLLPTLLDSDDALFEYAGRELSEGSSLMRFTYKLPNWEVRARGTAARVDLTGGLIVEASTGNVTALEFSAGPFPESFTFSRAEGAIRYGVVKLGVASLPLPLSAHFDITSAADGQQMHSQINLADCRQHGTVAEAACKPDLLPGGVVLYLLADSEIDLGTRAAGELITMVLRRPAAAGTMSLARNARVTGRLERVDKFDTSIVAVVRFLRIEDEGRLFRIAVGSHNLTVRNETRIPRGFRMTITTEEPAVSERVPQRAEENSQK